MYSARSARLTRSCSTGALPSRAGLYTVTPTHRQRARAAAVRRTGAKLLHGAAQARCLAHGFGRVPAGRAQQKFLAAEPAYHVRGARQHALQCAAHAAKRAVARKVAVRVVVFLEMVDIRHQNSHRLFAAAAHGQHGLRLFLPAPAVQKAREHVGAALPPQLFNAPFVPRPRSAREHAPRGVCRKNERARAQRRGQHTPARAFVISADDRSRPFSNFHIFPFSSL